MTANVEIPEGGAVTVEADGITVKKDVFWFNDSVIQVEFVITSAEERPTNVSMLDGIPVDSGPDEVEFHPKYDPYNWTETPSGDVKYETQVSPGERIVTAYGFKTDGVADLSWVRDPPEVETERPTASAEMEDVTDGGSASTLGVDEESSAETGVSSDDETVGATELDASTADATDVSTPSTESDGAPGAGGGGVDVSPVGTAEAPTASGEPDGPSGNDIDASTAAAGPERIGPSSETATVPKDDFYRSSSSDVESDDSSSPDGSVDANDTQSENTQSHHEGAHAGDESIARALLEELEGDSLDADEQAALRSKLFGSEPSESDGLQFEDLRDNVNDLELFIDALDEFIDENDGGTATLDEIRTELEEGAKARDGLHEEVEQLQTELEELGERVEAFQQLGASIESLEDVMEELREEFTELKSQHEDDIDGIDDRFDRLQQRVMERVRTIDSDLEEIQSSVERGRQWRERLGKAINAELVPSDDADGEGPVFD